MQRQIKSCTHCRQHKVRCDASKCYPKPCTRCSKFRLVCVVDQNFKPRKGGQVELLREHLAKIQEQIHNISKRTLTSGEEDADELEEDAEMVESPAKGLDLQHLHKDLDIVSPKRKYSSSENHNKPLSPPLVPGDHKEDEVVKADSFPQAEVPPTKHIKLNTADYSSKAKPDDDLETGVKAIEASVAERMAAGGRLVPIPGPYCLEDLVLNEDKADELHNYFMDKCAPYIPIFESSSAGELYARSEFLFWAVMTTAALAESTSDLYLSFVEPVKRLAAKKSLLATTRSSSVVQALLVLCTWPLPSEKILEDMSPRYASLAYSMGLQLGIHRGKFIYEFSRNQQLMPNAVKWRSRTWVQTYITQQMVSAASGIPPSMPVDYIIDHALHDEEHPLSARTSAFLKIAMFYSKLVSIMGTRISTQDGLMDPESRCPTLDLLRTDLYTMFPPKTNYEDPVIEIMFLYARCIMDNFAFLPETPQSYQNGFIVDAFQASTRIVTLARKLVGTRKITEFPSFIRTPCNYAALTLFRLQSMTQIPDQYVASARESVVTIHHMYRNIPPSWLDPRVSNDISRIAKILESLNHVMMIHPELLRSRRVMRRMRSHLTFSIFYELVYIIHEARRRNARKKAGDDDTDGQKVSDKGIDDDKKDDAESKNAANASEATDDASASANRDTQAKPKNAGDNSSPDSWTEDSPANTGAMHQLINSQSSNSSRDLNPLPLFNNIDRKSYVSSTVVSPNGTTMTKLVPANGYEHVGGQNGNNQVAFADVEANFHLHNHSSHSNSSHHRHHHHSEGNDSSSNASMVPHKSQFSQMYSVAHGSSNTSTSVTNHHTHIESYHGYSPRLGELPGPHMEPGVYGDMHDMMGSGAQQLFEGIDWMNTEGDDFLGWMLPRNE